MKMRTRMILASMATVAVMTGVAAASASAQTSIHYLSNGSPISGAGTTVHFVGSMSWENEAGGIDCSDLTVEVTFHTFEGEVVTLDCLEGETTGLLQSVFGCELKEKKETPLPWGVEPVSSSVMRLTGVDFIIPVEPGCAFGERLEFFESASDFLDMHTDVNGVIGSVTMSGTLEGTTGEVEFEGELSPTTGEPTITLVET